MKNQQQFCSLQPAFDALNSFVPKIEAPKSQKLSVLPSSFGELKWDKELDPQDFSRGKSIIPCSLISETEDNTLNIDIELYCEYRHGSYFDGRTEWSSYELIKHEVVMAAAYVNDIECTDENCDMDGLYDRVADFIRQKL